MLRTLSLTFAILALLVTAGLAFTQQVHLPPEISQGPGMDRVPITAGDEIQRKQARAASLQRQAEVRRDSEKMAQLIADLNDYLQKNEQGVVSVDAIKKAEQIEKLAHSVKSKMKQSF